MNQFNSRAGRRRTLLGALLGLIPLFLNSGINLQAGAAQLFNVRDYGATGRKEGNAQQAIQRTIDAAAAAGGGTVWLPTGLYTSGTLHLRSHVRIALAAGATLFADTDPKAYDCGGVPSKAALFSGENLEDVSLTGEGIVDGQAQYDWRPDDFEHDFDHKTWMQNLGKSLLRPFPKDFPARQIYPHLVWLARCRDVHISGLNFLHSPSWTFALYACRNATFDRLYIYTSLKAGVWADGIDLDGCRDVSIADCAIETGDDCVALSSANTWGPALPCDSICVSNCRLSSASAGIKFAEGNIAGVRNVRVVHSLLNNVNRGAVFLTGLGGVISNVTLSDLTINCSRFDWYWAGDGQPFRCGNFHHSDLDSTASKKNDVAPGSIRQLTFSNIVAHAKGCSLFYGHPDCWLDSVALVNLQLFVSKDPAAPFDKTEHGLDFRRVARLKLRNVEVRWEPPELSSWRSALNCEDIHGLLLDNAVGFPLPPPHDVPAIALRQVSDAVISHARAVEGTDVLFEITGPRSQNIRFENNDFSLAKVPCRLGNDIPAGAVQGLSVTSAAGP